MPETAFFPIMEFRGYTDDVEFLWGSDNTFNLVPGQVVPFAGQSNYSMVVTSQIKPGEHGTGKMHAYYQKYLCQFAGGASVDVGSTVYIDRETGIVHPTSSPSNYCQAIALPREELDRDVAAADGSAATGDTTILVAFLGVCNDASIDEVTTDGALNS